MRILVAVDGSPASRSARDLVAGLPWSEGTSLRLVTVYEPPIDWSGGLVNPSRLAAAEEAIRDELRPELEWLAAPLEGHGWTVEPRLVGGRLPRAVVDEAREWDADLIVIGSRGHGPVAALLAGSTSAEIVGAATCPVLVAKGSRISRLLVATDGSDSLAAAPAVLARWAVFDSLPVDVVSVAPVHGSVRRLDQRGMSDDSEREALIAFHRSAADSTARALHASGIKGTPFVAIGSPPHEIAKHATRLNSDLIVTGARELEGLERLVVGSPARNIVLHAPCSVLVLNEARGLPRAESEPAAAAEGAVLSRAQSVESPAGGRGASPARSPADAPRP